MKNPFRFKYDIRSMNVGNVTWYCQKPGRVWATDPRKFPAWQFKLDYRRIEFDEPDRTGWYLTGPAVSWKGEYVGETIAVAVSQATVYLPEEMR